MDQEHSIAFGPFRLEATQGRLWQGDQVIPLRPRSLALLGYRVGKTTVVEMFLRRLAAGAERRTTWGQCVEHTGEGEPYLPFVEALGPLGHEPAVLAVLRRYAPLWLAQLPRLVSEDAHLVEVRCRHGVRQAISARDSSTLRQQVIPLQAASWLPADQACPSLR
jgi:hypothetical protein